jgi:gluconolactonase
MSFEKLHPEFERIVGEGGPKRLITGMAFTEGPVWLEREQCVLFTDIPNNAIMRWDKTNGLSIYNKHSHYAIGLYLDLEERLIACEHSTKRLTRYEKDGSATTLASHHGNAILNSTNDVCVRSDGAIFFTDPPFGVRQEDGHLHGYQVATEYNGCNVFKVTGDPSKPYVVTDKIYRPNGLCFSPDEKILYVSDSSDKFHCVYALELHNDTAVDSSVFTVLPSGVPDGMRVDTEGRLYVAGPDGVYVYTSDATLLGKILVPEMVTNLCFGGKDRQQLFITAVSSLYTIELQTTGVQKP